MELPNGRGTLAGSSNWTSPVSDIEVLESVEPLDSIPMDAEFIDNVKKEISTSSGPHANRSNFSQSTVRPNVRGMIEDPSFINKK